MITLRQFTDSEIPFGMALKEQAGWNQQHADWQRTLALQPNGGFVAEWDGQPAGTVMVTLYDDVAWVSMMLVDAELRGRGIGGRLMETALQFADGHNARSVRLDATPLGQPLYERLGFTADFALMRYAGLVGWDESSSPTNSMSHVVRLADSPHPTQIADYDRRVTGTNRRRLLELLAKEVPIWVKRNASSIEGFVTARRGSHSVQIGPCQAEESTGAELLLYAMRCHVGEPVLFDTPDDHHAAIEVARQHGLSSQRTLLRMTRGERVHEDRTRMWATFGPEKG